jgi:phosphoribosylamine--glycine ligase
MVGGQVVTNGGRVLGIAASGTDIRSARELAYSALERISFDGAHYRRDIGEKALQEQKVRD